MNGFFSNGPDSSAGEEFKARKAAQETLRRKRLKKKKMDASDKSQAKKPEGFFPQK